MTAPAPAGPDVESVHIGAQPPTDSPAEHTALTLLAAYLAGSTVAGGSAALLAALARAGIPRPVVRAVLRLVMQAGRTVSTQVAAAAGPATRATAAREAVLRARYVLAAARRLTRAVQTAARPSLPGGTDPSAADVTSGPSAAEALAQALAAERRWLAQHLEAGRNRRAAARRAELAAAQRGPMLLWNANADSCGHCQLLHGTMFHLDDPPGGVWPGGAHPHCKCTAEPAPAWLQPGYRHRLVPAPAEVAAANRRAAVLELARYVRTPAGERRFGKPIGTLITEKGGGRRKPYTGKRGADYVREALARQRKRESAELRFRYRINGMSRTDRAKLFRAMADEQPANLRRMYAAYNRWAKLRIQEPNGIGERERGVHDEIRKALGDLLTRQIRAMPDEQLSQRMTTAVRRNRIREFERYAEESERRERRRQAGRARSAAAAERRRQAKAAEWERLIEQGADDEEATERVYGTSVQRQRRAAALGQLRAAGYHGRSLDQVARRAFDDHVGEHYQRAEAELGTAMLTREAKARGIDERDLFIGPEARARRWASEELLAWWDRNGRPTYDEFLAELLDPRTAYRIRQARSDFLR